MVEIKAKQIYLWYGENDFEIHEKVMVWTRQFEKKHGRLNFFVFDLREAGAKEKIAVDFHRIYHAACKIKLYLDKLPFRDFVD